MDNKKDIRFFPIFIGATLGVILEIISTLVDEIVVGNIFNDEAFASVNLIEPYTFLEVFLAYLICVGGAALIGLILLASNVLPDAFDIDNAETARLAAVMLRILAPTAIFICLSRVTAIFYQYTRRITRTIILFGLTIAALPAVFGMLLGQIDILSIAVGIALGPAVAIALMYGYVRVIKKEKLFDYTLMHLD